MSQAGRLLALALATACVLVLCLWALVRQAEQEQQAAMAAQRDAYLLRHLRTAAENYLATGLQLEQMQSLQDVLEREQLAFGGVLAIDVFHPGGTVLYSTDAGSRGAAAPPEWLALLREDRPWQSASRGQRQIGQRFDNDLGQAAGGIVITLSTATAAPPTLAQWYGSSLQLLRWLLLGLAAALAALAGVALGLRRIGRPYGDAARLLRGQPLPSGRADTDLARAAARQRQAWEEERRRCRQAMRQLEALDHEA